MHGDICYMHWCTLVPFIVNVSQQAFKKQVHSNAQWYSAWCFVHCTVKNAPIFLFIVDHLFWLGCIKQHAATNLLALQSTIFWRKWALKILNVIKKNIILPILCLSTKDLSSVFCADINIAFYNICLDHAKTHLPCTSFRKKKKY